MNVGSFFMRKGFVLKSECRFKFTFDSPRLRSG